MDYVISQWDHSLLKMAEFDTQVYINARKDFKCREAKSRPETVERSKQEYLQAKRTMLTKLVELRADRAREQFFSCFFFFAYACAAPPRRAATLKFKC